MSKKKHHNVSCHMLVHLCHSWFTQAAAKTPEQTARCRAVQHIPSFLVLLYWFLPTPVHPSLLFPFILSKAWALQRSAMFVPVCVQSDGKSLREGGGTRLPPCERDGLSITAQLKRWGARRCVQSKQRGANHGGSAPRRELPDWLLPRGRLAPW